jgi:phosphatidylserine/phosphatidylglycerophosphate/cardiolipin synthase-like enzyme
MENAAYFDALRSALGKARRSIVILGVAVRPANAAGSAEFACRSSGPDRTPAPDAGESPAGSGCPAADLEVAAADRRLAGLLSAQGQVWFRKRMVEFRLDPPPAVGACHHQKVIIIDDAVAFCGGGDISTDRWDCRRASRRRSAPLSAVRADSAAAARSDGGHGRRRGEGARRPRSGALVPVERASGPFPTRLLSDPWPDDLEPDLRGTPVAIARTEPAAGGRAEVRENEALHLDAIRNARRLIYLENQYFTSPVTGGSPRGAPGRRGWP